MKQCTRHSWYHSSLWRQYYDLGLFGLSWQHYVPNKWDQLPIRLYWIVCFVLFVFSNLRFAEEDFKQQSDSPNISIRSWWIINGTLTERDLVTFHKLSKIITMPNESHNNQNEFQNVEHGDILFLSRECIV